MPWRKVARSHGNMLPVFGFRAPLCAAHIAFAWCSNRSDKFRAVFIRAPAVLEVGQSIEVLGQYELTAEEAAAQAWFTALTAISSTGSVSAWYAMGPTWHRLALVGPCVWPCNIVIIFG